MGVSVLRGAGCWRPCCRQSDGRLPIMATQENHMKKWIIAVFLLTLAVAISACSSEPTKHANTGDKPATTLPVIFFFDDTGTTEIYTLSLHDALPISAAPP